MMTQEQLDHVEVFFENYPSEEIYDQPDECNARILKMAEAVRGLRKEAVAKKSVALLEKARVLDAELTQVFMLLQQRHQQRAAASGIKLPGDLNGKHWRK